MQPNSKKTTVKFDNSKPLCIVKVGQIGACAYDCSGNIIGSWPVVDLAWQELKDRYSVVWEDWLFSGSGKRYVMVRNSLIPLT